MQNKTQKDLLMKIIIYNWCDAKVGLSRNTKSPVSGFKGDCLNLEQNHVFLQKLL